MYDFLKLEGENILLISDDAILLKENTEKNISVIITNKRMLLLDYPEKSNNYEEAMRTSRGSEYIMKKEPIFTIELDKIKSIEQQSNYDKYILYDTNYFYLKDDMIRNKIMELL